MTQSQAIHQALKQGSRLTPLDALARFGCMRLASRISDLKKDGVRINSRSVKTDSGKTVSEYWLDNGTLFGGEVERAYEHDGI